MTIGRKDKIKVGDIVRAISQKAGIPGKNIGNIALFDKFSFIEVQSSVADKVVRSINDMIFSGRKVKVSTAKDKDKRRK